MPVIPTVKTYGRSKNVNSNYLSKHTDFPSSKASSVFDALFAKNIEKRNTSSGKTKKIITRARRKQEISEELPLPGPSQLSSDDSVHFRANTTFDNLLKGPQYNNVEFCNASAIRIDSSTENSKDSDDHSSRYNTRKKVRKDYAKLHSNNERIKNKVNSKGKVNKQKISEKKKLSKSIKVVLKQIADKSTTTDTVSKNNISNSFDKSISHSLIIEKETKHRDQNSLEISRIIAEENKKYRENYFNASLVCARKFTPIISTSRILPKKSVTSESNCSQLFQHGFRHCMRAESTPKYMLSSTPIPSNKQQHKIAENPDVSPITARCRRSQASCKSRLVSLMDNHSDYELVPSFQPSSKQSLTNDASTKDLVNLISPSLKPAEEETTSVKSPPYNLRMNDDSRINYSSLLKYKRRVSYTKRRVKSASAVEGKASVTTKSQRQYSSLAHDIKLSVQPVVVIERNLDVLGITGKVRLICSFNSHNDIDVSDYKETDTNIVQNNNENTIASQQLCPVVLLEKLSLLSSVKQQPFSTVTTRSHSLKHSRHSSDNVNGHADLSKSLFNSSIELKRSNSDSNILHCDDKLSSKLEIDMKITNDSVINLVSDTSENIIENSQRETVKKSLYHITTRRKKVVSINPVNEVINARETTQNRFGISLQEWERFSQSNICIVKIDHLVNNENSLKKSLDSQHGNDVANKEKSVINSTCTTNKHTSPIRNDYMSTRSRKTSKTDTDVTRKSKNTIIGKQSIILKPGKQWFRSLSILRHTHMHNVNLSETCNKGRKWRDSVYEILENQEGNESAEKTSSNEHDISKTEYKLQPTNVRRRKTLKIVPLTNQLSTSQYGLSILEKSAENNTGYVSTFTDESVLESFDKLSLTTDVGDREETARQIILKRCGQTAPILFDDCYSPRILKKCRKIGEGVYGEVFMYKSSDNKCHVMKIIPIEGDQVVNGEHQKKFEEIISEIIIASELSNLRTNPEFCTDGFNELLSVCCVQGKYPQHLLDLWSLYDEDRGSENDSPEIFTDDQLYIVLDLANGGQDLEAYRFNNAEQAYSLFVQVVCSLAVAESALQFEHRDMHWGNILISATDEPTNTFRLNGREFEVATKGVKVSIIDFTLSRMTYNNCCIFNDLSLDPDLFTATGDYQFEIYRLMRKRNLDDWQRFEPYSNILWLDYTLDKMIHHLRYLRVNTKTHKTFIRRLTQVKKKVLTYNSATEFLNSDVLSHVFL